MTDRRFSRWRNRMIGIIVPVFVTRVALVLYGDARTARLGR